MFIRQWSLKHCCLFLAQVATEATFTIVRRSALWYKFGVELWAVGTIRQERRSGIAAGAVFVCVWYGQMITVEYAEEARFLRVASMAAMFSLPGSWTLTPDGDVHPELLLVPSATGLVCLDGRNQPILTTTMLAGHRLVKFVDFGVQRQIFSPVDLETEVTCEEYKTHGLPVSSTPVAVPVTSPGRRIASEPEELGYIVFWQWR